MRRDRQVADGKSFLVGHRPSVRDWRKRVDAGAHTVLGVVREWAARREGAEAGCTHGHRGPAGALQGRDAADVIVVRVRGQDPADILGPKAQRPDVPIDQDRRLRESPIKQDVSFSGGHQEG